MKSLYPSAICASVLLAFAAAETGAIGDGKKPKEPVVKPCTIKSPSSGLFFDLSSLNIPRPKDLEDGSKKRIQRRESWHARGYDYGSNFTLNFCAPAIEEVDNFEGVEKGLQRNVSAFYTEGKKTYSIGQQNSELVFRGSKLVLNYTNGSPCDDADSKRKRSFEHTHDFSVSEEKSLKKVRRKSTIISLLCQKDALPTSPQVTVAFVGASEDHCTYFFEARSAAACAGIESTPSQLGPGGVFGVILMIAFTVYFVGGCVYQRTVMNQRGWRQIPNYSMWAGIWGFFSDIFIILTSSCVRFLPGRRGYSRLSLNGNGNINRRHSDDENRLIDQLDEEWDD